MHVEILDRADDREYVAFLDRIGQHNPSILGYHYPMYRDMLVSIGVGTPFYLAARVGNEIVGVLPMFYQDSSVGRVYSSLPFFGPNAGVLCADTEMKASVHRALLATILSHAKEFRALSCSVYTPFLNEDFDSYDENLPEAIIVERFTQYLDLEDVSWNSSIKYDLRKADREGVELSRMLTPERIDEFYAIYKENCRDYAIPLKPKACVDFLLGENIYGRYSDMFFAFYEGKMIAGLLMLWSPCTASYYMPCTLHSARTLQPGTVLIDRAVQEAKTRGIRYWNWESSPSRKSGVYRFKKKWGSNEGTYRIYVKAMQSHEIFQHLGTEGLMKNFPLYFVYPFHLLAPRKQTTVS